MELNTILFCCLLSTILTFVPAENLGTPITKGDELVAVRIEHAAQTAHAVPKPVWVVSLSQAVFVAGTTAWQEKQKTLSLDVLRMTRVEARYLK